MIPSIYVDHPTVIPPQRQSCASMSCPPAARQSEVIDPLLVLRKKRSVYDSFTLTAFPQWCRQQRGRQRSERGREGGRRGLRLLLGKKNDAAAVLGACRQTERERE